ncbi:MAG TPA: tubulin-like doman-containing protein, partial [Gemmataceae bacterium]
DLEQVPMFRFLYLDSDPDATTKAVAVSQDVALTEAQVLPVPLRPASAYRRRQLDALSEWLPQQKLYAIPRSLQPMQSRALGRLAVADHYLRLLSRLRREVQVATHPESLANSLSQTGLPLRSNTPRVFIFADACSGSGGGLMDLGVTVRQALAQQRFAKAQVTVFLFCGSPEDPATPAAELANLYASLTELYHYADPAVTFSARYGADDGPAVSNEPFPFDSVYLLPLQHRSPEALRDAIAHLSTFVCNDLTTSLGVELDQARGAARGPEQTPFRGFGTYSVWFPRGLLLREAARQMAERLIEDWQAPGVESSDAPIDSICEGVLGDPGLQPESLREQLQAEAEAAGDSAPAQLVQALLEQLEEEAGPAGLGDAAEWAQRALDRVHETVGMRPGSELESAYQRGRTTRVWNEASRRLAETWGKHLADQVLRLLDFPGSRLAAGEAGLRRLIRFCNEKVEALARKVQERALRGQRERAEVQAALDACPQPGAFRLFSGSATRALNHFLDRVRAFCRHRVQEDLDHAVVQFYRHLAAFFEERLGDLSFCRYRLTPLRQALGRSMPARAGALGSLGLMGADPANPIPVSVVDPLREALRGAATLRVVLPRGELDLETAALAFLQRLGPDHWRHLEEVVQSLVLEPMGGLYALCLKSSDLAAHLSGALIEQTAAFLGELLPVADVAQVAFSASLAQHSDLRDQLREFHQSAAPLMSARQVPAGSYLLVPQGQAGDALGEHARAAIPGLHILTVSELSTDLVLCREDGFFPPEALKPLLRSCRGAYAEMAANPTTSPHSRFDVTEWILPE